MLAKRHPKKTTIVERPIRAIPAPFKCATNTIQHSMQPKCPSAQSLSRSAEKGIAAHPTPACAALMA
jgi:hypothetical protein